MSYSRFAGALTAHRAPRRQHRSMMTMRRVGNHVVYSAVLLASLLAWGVQAAAQPSSQSERGSGVISR